MNIDNNLMSSIVQGWTTDTQQNKKKRAGSYEHNWLACASMYLVAKLVPFNFCFCLFLRTLKHLASMVNAFDNVKTKKSEGWRWFLFLVSQSHYVVATSVCQSTRNQLSICLTTKGRERERERWIEKGAERKEKQWIAQWSMGGLVYDNTKKSVQQQTMFCVSF